MSLAIPFGSVRAKKAVETAVRVAKQGLGAYYHPRMLAEAWRLAGAEHWRRLALLACLRPEDGTDPILRAEVIDMLTVIATSDAFVPAEQESVTR